MTEHGPTIYEQAVTTHRSAELLARMHSFESISALAESLPQNAHVLDNGAGASPFGKEVAVLRPDITWINFDYSYQNPAILTEVSADAPANIKYMTGDATKLDEFFEPETFDAVFSYWLLPHLSIDSPEPALAAARKMHTVAKTGALISIGPKIGKGHVITLKARPAMQFIKDPAISKDEFATTVLNNTKLPPRVRFAQKLANEVATPFFGTSRYVTKPGKIPKVYHPKSQEYVSPLSRKGVATAGRLGIALAKHALKQRKLN